MSKSLGEAFPEEQARVRELLIVYRGIGPTGVIGAAMMEHVLDKAAKAVMSGDVAEMIVSYNELKRCE